MRCFSSRLAFFAFLMPAGHHHCPMLQRKTVPSRGAFNIAKIYAAAIFAPTAFLTMPLSTVCGCFFLSLTHSIALMMIEEVLVARAIDKRKFVTNRMRAIEERLSRPAESGFALTQ
jgi:hypothetical protein